MLRPHIGVMLTKTDKVSECWEDLCPCTESPFPTNQKMLMLKNVEKQMKNWRATQRINRIVPLSKIVHVHPPATFRDQCQ